MVVKIMTSAASMSSPLGYNEAKAEKGKATVIYSGGIADAARPGESFAPYEKANIRTRNIALHLSFNPSADENKRLSPKQMTNLVREYMEGMGYGKQPYIIYQHDDIDRRHYHVVSIKVDRTGRKIPDSNNFRRKKKRPYGKTINGRRLCLPSLGQIRMQSFPGTSMATRGQTLRCAGIVDACLP